MSYKKEQISFVHFPLDFIYSSPSVCADPPLLRGTVPCTHEHNVLLTIPAVAVSLVRAPAFSLLSSSSIEQVVSTFIDNYFDQNPISQLAIIQVKIEPLVHFSSLLVRGDRVDPPA